MAAHTQTYTQTNTHTHTLSGAVQVVERITGRYTQGSIIK